MVYVLGALCVLLGLVILLLVWKIVLLRRSADTLRQGLQERLETDTNTLLSIPSRDGAMRHLANGLNSQLRQLRCQRQRYQNGDRELKEAVANISHDLRTPLTAICGYLDLLARGDTSPEQERYLNFIANRVEAMRLLTEELLYYSVAAGGEKGLSLEPVDLSAALEEAVASFYGVLKKRDIAPRISLPEKRIVQNLNRAALSRVLDNLLSNALKYSGGDLNIALDKDGTIMLSNSAPRLDEVQVGQLFDRFFTVETARHSTGLGLSIAKTLVERMGGTISAQYEEGRLSIYLRFGQ